MLGVLPSFAGHNDLIAGQCAEGPAQNLHSKKTSVRDQHTQVSSEYRLSCACPVPVLRLSGKAFLLTC